MLLVEAVLDLGSTRQTVLVRSIGGAIAGGVSPASGASVAIITPDGAELMAVEDETDFRGAYVVDLETYGARLNPGATYTLRVVARGGREATGTTTIPLASPVAESPDVQEFSRSADTLRAQWPRVPGAKSYYVVVNGSYQYAPPGFSQVNYAAFVDTSFTLPGTIDDVDSDEAFFPGDTATVVVAAVDDNFYRYYHANVDPFAGAPPSRLQGAVGVFGSLVPIYRQRFAVMP